MSTIKVNTLNFGKEISKIYENVINYGELKIQIIKPKTRLSSHLKWTDKEENAEKKAMKDLKANKNIITSDKLFSKLGI